MKEEFLCRVHVVETGFVHGAKAEFEPADGAGANGPIPGHTRT